MLLTKEGLHALSSRRNDITRTMKTLALADIKPITKSKRKGISGGAEDLGNFAEGDCLKVNAMAKGEETTWIMCCDTDAEKVAWLDVLMFVKGKYTSFS